MSSIRVRLTPSGDVRHDVQWRQDGRSRSLSFTDYEGATKWRALLDQVGPAEALRIAQVTPAKAKLTTLTDWCGTYIAGLTGVQEGTRRRYRTIVTHDIATGIGVLPLQMVTEATIAAWVQGLAGSGKTIANKHGFLSAALAAAVAAKLIPTNPCEGRRLPRTERQEMCFLEPSDFALLLHYITDPWKPLVTLLVSTGLRWGEATALRVGDIDVDKGTLRVTRAWKYTAGEGHRIGPPKSRKSVRTVRLSQQTMESITPLLSRDASELLFTNYQGNAVRSATFHDNVWQPAVRLANGEPAAGAKRIARRRDSQGEIIQPAPDGMRLGKRPRIHDLRHSYASWLIHGGVPLPVIQQTLGHESITTTIGTYGHLDTRSLDSAAAVISGALTLALPEVLELGR